MGRVSTDRKVYMEPQEQLSSPSITNKDSITQNQTNTGSNNNTNFPATTTTTEKSTEGGSSTIRSGLTKLSSFNGTRKKAFTRLGSQNDYEQILEEQPPSSDIRHAAATGIFSAHHRSNTFGGIGARSPLHRGRDEMVVRFDDPSSPGAESTSNGAADTVVGSGGPARQCVRPGELVIAQPSSPHEPLLKQLDSFDVDDDDDEHFRVRSSVTSPSAAAPAAGHVPGAVQFPGVGAVTGTGGNSHPGLPPRPPKVEVRDSCPSEGDRGGSQGVGSTGILSQGSYDFWNDLPAPEGSSPSIEAGGGGTHGNASISARRKAKSFDFGTVVEDDPPTKLIAGFLRRQTESGSNSLDLDLDMDELTPIPRPSNEGSFSPIPASDLKEQQPTPTPSPSPGRDSSYGDLVRLDHPVTVSVPTSFRTGAPTPNAEEFARLKGQLLKDQTIKYHSDPLPLPPDGKPPDVKINVGGDERYAKSREEAFRVAATTRSPSPENGINSQLESPGSARVRWRKNSSFRPSSSPPNPRGSGEEEVLKAPAQYVVRPSFSRLKSRLADLPKPPEITKASGPIDGAKMKSAQLRSATMKLKKVDEEEEDPLKVTDLPEKYRKREKGFWTIFQLSALLVILAGLACVLSFPSLRKMKRGGLVLWKWVLLVLVVFCGRLISGWIVWVLVFIIEKNFLLRKRVVYFVYALRKGVQNCLWLGFALLAWHFMIDPHVDSNQKVVKYVTKVLVCFLVAAIIVLIKTFLVKVLASSFHVNNYFERIQEALFNQYIMETLAGPPMVEYEQDAEEDLKRFNEEIAVLRDAGASGPSLSKVGNLPPVARASGLPPRPSVNTKSTPLGAQSGMKGAQQSSGMIGRGPKAGEKKNSGSKAELNLGISVDHLQKLDLSNISAWNMKRLMHILRNSTLTHSLDECVNAEGETEIQSEWQAKCAAKQIFKNVAKPGHRVIMEDDLLRFMYEEETKKALDQFDGATEKRCITKQALKKWVISVYKERRALALSLNDTKTAVNKLHRMIDVVVCIIIIIIWLLLLGIATTKFLLFLSSQILLLILVWGNTFKTIFEATVFLFIMHPYDVGDRCVIDGVQLVVEEMNILTTVFLGDGNVKIWFPNSVLATKPIQNFYRSPEMGDCIEFIVQASTPVHKITAFKERVGKYIESKTNHWHPDYSLNVVQMAEGERMKLSVGLKHTMNYQDMGEIVKRRSELLIQTKLYLEELDIQYHAPAQEVHVRQLGP